MLSALLLAGLIATPVATFALFVPTAFAGRAFGAWPWIRRFVLALLSTSVLAAGTAGALTLLGVTAGNAIAGAAGIVVVSLAWLPVTRRWSARAHVCWSTTTF